jgi:hypothetical protein
MGDRGGQMYLFIDDSGVNLFHSFIKLTTNYQP